MEKFLKDRSYYENIYDNYMIESCKMLEKSILKSDKNRVKEKNEKKALLKLLIMLEKHSWYKNREKSINDMMNKDKKSDELLKNSIPFKEKNCRLCNGNLKYKSKVFRSGSEKKDDRILFLYKCNNCNKGQGIYSDGEEIISKPKLCNKCGEIISHKAKFEGDILIEDFNCLSCLNKYTEKTDYSTLENKKTKISEKDRLKYGYNKKENDDYNDTFDRLDSFYKYIKENKEKEKKKDIYYKVKKLDKLNIIKLKKLLNNEFSETNFSEFKIISDTNVRGGIEIEYSLFFDGNFGENPKSKLNKIYEKILFNTNWESKKNSISEKLGIVNGKLVGFDDEDELVKLTEKREKNKKLN